MVTRGQAISIAVTFAALLVMLVMGSRMADSISRPLTELRDAVVRQRQGEQGAHAREELGVDRVIANTVGNDHMLSLDAQWHRPVLDPVGDLSVRGFSARSGRFRLPMAGASVADLNLGGESVTSCFRRVPQIATRVRVGVSRRTCNRFSGAPHVSSRGMLIK